MFWGRCIIAFLIATGLARADFSSLPDCADADLADGPCVGPAAALRPTQFAMGQRRMVVKLQKLQALSRADRQAYLARNPIPVVVGPRCELYLVDHHHLARAVLEAGHSKVVLEMLYDWSHLNEADFWARMERRRLVHLLDENGVGPWDPLFLPRSVRDLKDDPYRSLAGFAQEQGCYTKTTIPYAEFQWAEYFRPRIPVGKTNAQFAAAIQAALAICHDPAASGLPGYIP